MRPSRLGDFVSGVAVAGMFITLWWGLMLIAAGLGPLVNAGCAIGVLTIAVASIVNKRSFIAVGLITTIVVPFLALAACLRAGMGG